MSWQLRAAKYAIWWAHFPEATVGNMLSAYIFSGSKGRALLEGSGLTKYLNVFSSASSILVVIKAM